MSSFFARHKTGKVLAGLLAVWLSGFVLLFCCGAMAAAEARGAAESCPLARAKSHCDKAERAKKDAPIFALSSSLTFDCCGFLPAVFDKTRKIEKTPQIIGVSRAKVDAPKFLSVASNFAVAEVYRAPQLARKKIFIKNRVFRI